MEVLHRETYGGAHALHLMLAPLVQCQLDAADPRSAPDDASPGRRGSPVVELDAFSKTS